MKDGHKHYLTLIITQLLIALLVGCFVMWMVPAVDRIAAGAIGFGAAFLVTIWPFRAVHWHRARRGRKAS
ncbi:MAG: hypothetical protein AB7F74_04380 [Parvibaculaceae bacterium]